MTALFRTLGLFCLTALLAACYPTSEHLIGVPAAPTTDARLLGGWRGQFGTDKDAVTYLFILPREAGRLEAMLVHAPTKDDKGAWMTASLIQGKAGASFILNARLALDDGGPAKDGAVDYTPVMYDFDKTGTLRLFVLDEKALEAAIREGRVKGSIKESSIGDDVRLSEDSDKMDSFFAANAPSLFTKPLGMFRRVS